MMYNRTSRAMMAGGLLRPRTDGYEPIDSTTGSAFVWLIVNVMPIPKDQDNPWRFSFYYLFTDIS